MKVALGRSHSDEAKPGIHKLSKVEFLSFLVIRHSFFSHLNDTIHITQVLGGHSGLFFTNLATSDVRR